MFRLGVDACIESSLPGAALAAALYMLMEDFAVCGRERVVYGICIEVGGFSRAVSLGSV